MEWVNDNILLIVFLVAMAAMHLFGHGHGGHREPHDDRSKSAKKRPDVSDDETDGMAKP